ncbi:linear gramicidin synthase subunit B [Colletotrichum tofieldiae]|nr:linear gramicidin synthase subunit B [Colletotrichum tofieldiae]
MQRTLKLDLSRPFNIVALPLFRTKVFKLPDGTNIVFTVFHYVIADEESVQMFSDDLRSRTSIATKT